jgi:hypothetical protein
MDQYSLTDEETISRISDFCPRAMSSYFICLNKSSSGHCTFTRNEIRDEKIRSWTKFKNDIRKLSQLYIVNFLDSGDRIDVEVIQQVNPWM